MLDPTDFRKTLPPRFQKSDQEEDASEFIRILLDILERKCDIVKEVFMGEKTNIIFCEVCNRNLGTKEKFYDILVLKEGWMFTIPIGFRERIHRDFCEIEGTKSPKTNPKLLSLGITVICSIP